MRSKCCPRPSLDVTISILAGSCIFPLVCTRIGMKHELFPPSTINPCTATVPPSCSLLARCSFLLLLVSSHHSVHADDSYNLQPSSPFICTCALVHHIRVSVHHCELRTNNFEACWRSMVGSLHLQELDAPPIFRLVLPLTFISPLVKSFR